MVERHTFEYAHCCQTEAPTLLTRSSGPWRNRKFRGICICSGDPCHSLRSPERIDRVGLLSILARSRTDILNSAVLGTYFLNETLGTLGKIGCALCLIGSVVIVLHDPPDPEIESINTMLDYAISPGT